MTASEKIVLSASRRTDIPAFYMDWFMDRMERGFFEVQNPFNKVRHTIPATNDRVHSIVFWSKDFSCFLKGGYGTRLVQKGHHLFFQFTINSQNRILEPGIRPLEQRLEQLDRLSGEFPPQAITWRFDPLCFYRVGSGPVQSNLDDLQRIADRVARLGIRRCVTSFMDMYPKILKRTTVPRGFAFVEPPMQRRRAILLEAGRECADRGLELSVCCEKELVESLPPGAGIASSACISHCVMESLYGKGLSRKKDRGQRAAQGCGCMESKDVGSYNEQPCFHNCLFCYANPRARASAGTGAP